MDELLPKAATAAAAAAVLAAYQWRGARAASRDALPLQYDVDAIERYFALRPDAVLSRALELAVEGVALAVRGALNAVALRLVRAPRARASLANVRATELREAITRLGPAFIKLGQALSSRPDLVDEQTMAELSLLQDALPFFPNGVARALVREELGAYPERLFDEISAEPVAAASLGQVYKAKIGGGASVAVKVQRPGLVDRIALDCHILRTVAGALAGIARLPGVRFRTDLVSVVDEYASRLFEELDYETEARNMRKFQRLYGHLDGIYIPQVYEEFSARRVITTEWIDGTKVVNERAKVSPNDLALLQVGIQCTLMQLLDKGFLHADPHGGNLLKTPSGKLAYLDFGLVSDIPASVMDTIICATVHLMNRAYPALAGDFPGLALMSADDAQRDLPAFAAALEEVFDPIMLDLRAKLDAAQDGGGGAFPPIPFASIVDRLFSLAQEFNFVVPPYFLSNLRALGELEGLAMTADASFNLVGAVYPYVARRLLTDPSPRLRRALQEFVIDDSGLPRWDVIDTLLHD
ncbi:ABC1 family-domain-containing protein, partial [Tribonema minus]